MDKDYLKTTTQKVINLLLINKTINSYRTLPSFININKSISHSAEG